MARGSRRRPIGTCTTPSTTCRRARSCCSAKPIAVVRRYWAHTRRKASKPSAASISRRGGSRRSGIRLSLRPMCCSNRSAPCSAGGSSQGRAKGVASRTGSRPSHRPTSPSLGGPAWPLARRAGERWPARHRTCAPESGRSTAPRPDASAPGTADWLSRRGRPSSAVPTQPRTTQCDGPDAKQDERQAEDDEVIERHADVDEEVRDLIAHGQR